MNIDIQILSRVSNFFIDSKFDLKTNVKFQIESRTDLKTNVKFRIESKTDLKTKQTDSY